MIYLKASFVTTAVVVASLLFGVMGNCSKRDSRAVGGICMAQQYADLEGQGSLLKCTAKDAGATLHVGEFLGTCTTEDDTVKVPATLKVVPNANEVFDLALWVGTGSDTAPAASAKDDATCDIYVLPPCVSTTDDGDYCGDVTKTEGVNLNVVLEVKCTGFETGKLAAPYCFSWRQGNGNNPNQGNENKANPVCHGAHDVRPGGPAKCACDDGFGIDVCPPVAIGDHEVVTTCPPDREEAFSVEINFKDISGVATGNKWTIGSESGHVDLEDLLVIDFDPSQLEQDTLLEISDGSCTITKLNFIPMCSCVQVGGPCDIDMGQNCCQAHDMMDGDIGVCVENPSNHEESCCAYTADTKGDPHLVGFKGQKFDFTGTSGESYALLVDEPSTVLTMEVHAPIPELPVITYITGVGLTAADTDGAVHTIQIHVDEPADFYAHHECPTREPCLAEGVLTVLLDGEPMTGPGVASLGPGVSVGAINIPGECRPFGFENYWADKVRQAELASAGGGGRRLEGLLRDMERWITDDSSATNAAECAEYAKRAVADDTLFTHQGEHASFQIVTPELTVRLNHGKLHQIAMRDPTDQYDLPDHRTYQMNMAIERAVLGHSARGVLGGTMRPTRDVDGIAIMHGVEAFRGGEEDYHVSGPFDNDFAFNQDMTNVM